MKIYYSYIKIKLLINSKRNIMHTYIVSNDELMNKVSDTLLEDGYYISNYLPHIYLIHPILYED